MRSERITEANVDTYWSDRFGFPAPGVYGTVYASVVDKQGNLYIGGRFSHVGGILAENVAKWDGTCWTAVGSGVGGEVLALAFDSQGNLYAGGSRLLHGTAVIRWDGANWSAIGQLNDGSVKVMAVDREGVLYAGGSLNSPSNVVRWDGANWKELGSGMSGQPGGVVWSLAIGADGSVYAGGIYAKDAAVPQRYVARWDGNTWSSMGSRIKGSVKALATDSRGRLFACVDEERVEDTKIGYLAEWDGSDWRQCGSPFSETEEEMELPAIAIDPEGNLVVGGNILRSEGLTVNRIAVWNGRKWSALGSGIGDGKITCLAYGRRGELYAGGRFHLAGETLAFGIARWDQSTWESLPMECRKPEGIYGTVYALARDRNNHLYVGGDFVLAGNLLVNNIAKWDGHQWSPLGSGVNGRVNALALDSAGNLYAGGYFTQAGDRPVKNIARWDGSAWSAMEGGVEGRVHALVVDGQDRVYAGGGFYQAGSVLTDAIAVWDGVHWSALGSGLYGGVYALALDKEGSLYAGGGFYRAGDIQVRNVAKWDGKSWTALGFTLVDGNVHTLVFDAYGDLYAGGTFQLPGDLSRLAKWDGNEWSSLHYAPSGGIYAMAFDDVGNLYLGGVYHNLAISTNGIVKWNRSSFTDLGSGVDGTVYTMSMGSEDLFLGGDFQTAGMKSSFSFAQWNLEPADLVVRSCNGVVGGIVETKIHLTSRKDISKLHFDLVFEPFFLTFLTASPAIPTPDGGKRILILPRAEGRLMVVIGEDSDRRPIGNGTVVRLRFSISDNYALGPHTMLDFRIERGEGFSSPDSSGYPILDNLHQMEIVDPPVLEYLSSTSGPPGSLLALRVSRLGSCYDSIRVRFSGQDGYETLVTPLEISGNRVTVAVPLDARGTLHVRLDGTEGKPSESLPFVAVSTDPFSGLVPEIQNTYRYSVVPYERFTSTAIDTANDRAYIRASTSLICNVDLATGSVLTSFGSDGSEADARMAINPFTRHLAITNPKENRLRRSSIKQDEHQKDWLMITVGSEPVGIDIDPWTNRAIVANSGSGNVTLVDLDKMDVLATIPTGSRPTEVVVDKTYHRAFVAHTGDNSIWEVDLSAYRAVDRGWPAGATPRCLAYHEETGLLLVGTENGLMLFSTDQSGVIRLLEGECIDGLAVHPSLGLGVVSSNTTKSGQTGWLTTLNLFMVLRDTTRAMVGRTPMKQKELQGLALNPWSNRGAFTKWGNTLDDPDPYSNGGYTLWSIPSSMNFPRLFADPAGDILALAVSNPTVEPGTFSLTAMSDSGEKVSGIEGKNPVVMVLPGKAQLARYESEDTLFGKGILGAGNLWHKLVSPNPGLKAFFLTADPQFRESIVGVEETGSLLTEMILPAIRPLTRHPVCLLNPFPIATTVEMKLINDAGALLQAIMVEIPAYGIMQKPLTELFPQGMSGIGTSGYVRASAASGVRGYQLLLPEGKKDAAGLNAQSAISGPPTLNFAYWVVGQEAGTGAFYETRAGIVNLESSEQTAVLTIRGGDGRLLADPKTISLPANGRVEPNLQPFFALPAGSLTQGWLKIEGSGRLSGYLTYGTQKALAAVTSMSQPRMQLTFSHVAEAGTGFFTGLALLNTNAEPATLTISVYKAGGQKIVTSNRITIAANGQKVALLHQLVGDIVKGQAGGYIVVQSDLPIQGIEIFGTDTLSAMANVPAQ